MNESRREVVRRQYAQQALQTIKSNPRPLVQLVISALIALGILDDAFVAGVLDNWAVVILAVYQVFLIWREERGLLKLFKLAMALTTGVLIGDDVTGVGLLDNFIAFATSLGLFGGTFFSTLRWVLGRAARRR